MLADKAMVCRSEVEVSVFNSNLLHFTSVCSAADELQKPCQHQQREPIHSSSTAAHRSSAGPGSAGSR